MNEPIRILHVLTAMNMAGTETLLMNLYRKMDRSIIQFDFAVSESQECAYDKEILEMGGRIYHYSRYKGINHISYVNWWKKFYSEHPEYKIIHGHIGSTAAIYLSIAKKMGRYTIAHSHNTNSKLSIHSFLYRIFSFPTRFIADYFFGCSYQALVDRYGSKIANDRNTSKVFNNGIDAIKFIYNPEMREIIRKNYYVSEKDFVIGTIGRLTLQKNPYEIIRICSELKNRNLNFYFWWFGTGEMEDEIRKLIEENQLSNIVKLMGVRSDVYNVLQGMDVFIFPSLWEGLGISCVEAQASGLPTLCSNVIPIEARITKDCEFIELNNTNLWVDKIEELYYKINGDNYTRSNEYEEIVKSNYDITDIAKWLMSFYEDIINKL